MLGAVTARMEILLCLFLSLPFFFPKFRADNFQNGHEERETHSLNSPKSIVDEASGNGGCCISKQTISVSQRFSTAGNRGYFDSTPYYVCYVMITGVSGKYD